jgi:nucleotide-binding universal stress UspA family protein
MVVLVLTGGRVERLGDLYSFGLLGTLSLSSFSLDVLRWREKKRGAKFWLGAFTTLALAAAWGINMFHKPHALLFGGGLSVIIVGAALAYRAGLLTRVFPRVPLPTTTMPSRGVTAEMLERLAAAHPQAARVLTVEEARELQPLEASKVLIAVRGKNPRLLEDAAVVARGLGEKNVYIVFVDEVPGLYYPPDTGPSPEANLVLTESAAELSDKFGITGIPLWRISSSAAAALADAAEKLGVQVVMLGASKRTAVWKLLRGEVVSGLLSRLPEERKLYIAN